MQGIKQERIIIVGTNGTGKSTFADKVINATVEGFEDKHALAVLPDDSEPLFRPYNELQENELKYINQIANKKNKIFFEKPKLFNEIQEHFRNGTLVLDDVRFYSGSIDEGIRRLFIRSRQNNIHILYICHGLSEISPSIITFATKIVLFNTVDSWQRLRNKIPNPDKFEQYVNDIRRAANNHKPNCDARRGGGCSPSCGAAYVKKIIDVKRDLIQASYD